MSEHTRLRCGMRTLKEKGEAEKEEEERSVEFLVWWVERVQ